MYYTICDKKIDTFPNRPYRYRPWFRKKSHNPKVHLTKISHAVWTKYWHVPWKFHTPQFHHISHNNIAEKTKFHRRFLKKYWIWSRFSRDAWSSNGTQFHPGGGVITQSCRIRETKQASRHGNGEASPKPEKATKQRVFRVRGFMAPLGSDSRMGQRWRSPSSGQLRCSIASDRALRPDIIFFLNIFWFQQNVTTLISQAPPFGSCKDTPAAKK